MSWRTFSTVSVPRPHPRSPTPCPEAGASSGCGAPRARPAGRPSRCTSRSSRRRRGCTTLLVDGDAWSASVAQLLELSESPSVTQAARLAARGWPTPLAGCLQAGPDGLQVLAGLPRAELWPEVTPEAWRAVLTAAATTFDVVVVDVAAPIEEDEELVVDRLPFRRNLMTTGALDRADLVLLVAAADPIGLRRGVIAHRQLVDRDHGRVSDVSVVLEPRAAQRAARAGLLARGRDLDRRAAGRPPPLRAHLHPGGVGRATAPLGRAPFTVVARACAWCSSRSTHDARARCRARARRVRRARAARAPGDAARRRPRTPRAGRRGGHRLPRPVSRRRSAGALRAGRRRAATADPRLRRIDAADRGPVGGGDLDQRAGPGLRRPERGARAHGPRPRGARGRGDRGAHAGAGRTPPGPGAAVRRRAASRTGAGSTSRSRRSRAIGR